MKINLFILSSFLVLMLPRSLYASPFYVSTNMGAWLGTFQQTGYSQSSPSTTTPILPGLQFQFGLRFPVVSFEYNITWLLAQSPFIPNGPLNNQGTYWSALGGNVGLEIFPMIRPYLGVESGNFGFITGSTPGYSGTSLKLGADFFLVSNPIFKFGLTGQILKCFVSSDSGGSLPSEVSTSIMNYFIGLKISN